MKKLYEEAAIQREFRLLTSGKIKPEEATIRRDYLKNRNVSKELNKAKWTKGYNSFIELDSEITKECHFTIDANNDYSTFNCVGPKNDKDKVRRHEQRIISSGA